MTRTSDTSGQRRVLNPVAALLVMGVVICGWLALDKLHSRQLGRTQDFLRASAFAALEKQEHREARKRLVQYLAMRPRDLEAREKLSQLLSTQIRTRTALEQAFALNEDLLRSNSASPELRLTQARIAVDLGLLADAEAHLKVLRTSLPDHATVWHLSGQVAHGRRDLTLAADCFDRSIQCASPEPTAFLERASLIPPGPESLAKVDSLLADMVTHCPRPTALRARAGWLMKHDRPEAALPDLTELLTDHPDDPTLNAMQVRCLQSGLRTLPENGQHSATITAAVSRLRKQTAAQPSADQLQLCLASLQWSSNDRPAAIRTLETGIRFAPRAWSLHQALIEYLTAEHQPDQARRMFAALPSDGTDSGSLPRSTRLFLEGRILMAEEKWSQAGQVLDRSLAFADPKSDLFTRIQLSQAVCHARSGAADDAVEAFRTIVESDPDSQSAKLGIAAARVQSGQLDLAIAEYRQMLDMPGVPAFLADLLIRRNLQLASSLRDWSEIDRLTRTQAPLITDPVQRALLQIDRLFASGEFGDALTQLEWAAAEFPDRVEMQQAARQLRTDHATSLIAILNNIVATDSNNSEAAAALVRLHLADGDTTHALKLLTSFARDSAQTPADTTARLRFGLATTNAVIQSEAGRGRTELIPQLRGIAINFATRLVAIDATQCPILAGLLARAGKLDDALAVASHNNNSGSGPNSSRLTARALREVMLFSDDLEAAAKKVLPLIYELIRREPASVDLRLAYADALIAISDNTSAVTTLKTIPDDYETGAIVASRQAWLMAVGNQQLDEAATLAESAAAREPQRPEHREVQARVAIARGDFNQAVELLEAIAPDGRSLAGDVYLAAALVRIDRMADVQPLLHRIRSRQAVESLFAADTELLVELTNRVTSSAPLGTF